MTLVEFSPGVNNVIIVHANSTIAGFTRTITLCVYILGPASTCATPTPVSFGLGAIRSRFSHVGRFTSRRNSSRATSTTAVICHCGLILWDVVCSCGTLTLTWVDEK